MSVSATIVSSKSRARLFLQTDEKSGLFSDEVQQEAREVLERVGWARPQDDGEMTSDDPFVRQINEGIQRDFGVQLDDLLNPAKVGMLTVSNSGFSVHCMFNFFLTVDVETFCLGCQFGT